MAFSRFSLDLHVKNARLQSNLNSLNTDGSFTMANSNSFLSPDEILPIDQENKYLRKLSYFIMKLCRTSIDFPELSIFASRHGALNDLHWLELPMARTIFHDPKGVRAIEVRLYSVLK